MIDRETWEAIMTDGDAVAAHVNESRGLTRLQPTWRNYPGGVSAEVKACGCVYGKRGKYQPWTFLRLCRSHVTDEEHRIGEEAAQRAYVEAVLRLRSDKDKPSA